MKKATNKQEAAVRTAVSSAGPVIGKRALNQASNAQIAEKAMRAAYNKALDGAVSSGELSKRARNVLESTGASQQVKGHFIEELTIKRYNQAGKLVGKKMEGRLSSTNPGYDATRFVKGKFAGGAQIKSGASGAEKAYSQIEKIKPQSAKNATLITCDDQVAAAQRKLNGRMRVKGNGVTLKHAENQTKDGLEAIARKGSRASSVARAYGKAGVSGAVIGATVGAAKEAKALKNGDISKRHFIENRGVDAVEGGAGAMLGAAGASAASAGAAAILGTATGGAAAASAGAAATTALGVIGGWGTGGAIIASAGATITAPVAIPAIAATGAAIGVGVLVQKGGKIARRKLEDRRAVKSEHAGRPVKDPDQEIKAFSEEIEALKADLKVDPANSIKARRDARLNAASRKR